MANSTNFDTPKDNGCCQVPVRTKNCTTFSIILQNVRIPPGLLMLSYHARLKLPALTSKHCAALTPKPPSARTCKPRYPQQIVSRGTLSKLKAAVPSANCKPRRASVQKLPPAANSNRGAFRSLCRTIQQIGTPEGAIRSLRRTIQQIGTPERTMSPKLRGKSASCASASHIALKCPASSNSKGISHRTPRPLATAHLDQKPPHT